MICEHCGCVFCWDEADEGGDRPRRYCSRACRKNALKARGIRTHHRTQVRLRMCRERPKTGYVTREAALLAVAQLRRIPPMHPYECPCGAWHLTSEPSEPDVNAEFAAFLAEFAEVNMEASGVPEDQRELWRGLR